MKPLGHPMKINLQTLEMLVAMLVEQHLLTKAEAAHVTGMAATDFPFAPQLAMADSVHLHIHTAEVAQLPHTLFLQQKATVATQVEGYIKYVLPGGLNLIFSHVKIAEDVGSLSENSATYLDHIGIDIRSEEKKAYLVFQQIPLLAAQQDYPFTRQGGTAAVQCCHSQVKEKYWVFPAGQLNYEFAFGPLQQYAGGFGVDVRPANPFSLPTEEKPSACCSGYKPAVDSLLKITLNTVVFIRYRMQNSRGEVLEDILEGNPVSYLHGAHQLHPSLEAKLTGLQPGDRKSVVVARDQDFPDMDDDFCFDVIIDDIRPGYSR